MRFTSEECAERAHSFLATSSQLAPGNPTRASHERRAIAYAVLSLRPDTRRKPGPKPKKIMETKEDGK